jgi:hypothetical protein
MTSAAVDPPRGGTPNVWRAKLAVHVDVDICVISCDGETNRRSGHWSGLMVHPTR